MNTTEEEKCQELMLRCNQQINRLLPSEAKYYLYLLANSFKGNHSTYAVTFLQCLYQMINTTIQLNANQLPNNNEQILQKLSKDYAQLQKIAQINTLGRQALNTLITLGSCLSSVVMGIAVGLIGGIAGFIQGWHESHIAKGTALGLSIGCMVGATLGYRYPKKTFINQLLRHIEYAINALKDCMQNLKQSYDAKYPHTKPFTQYLKEEQQRIRASYFDSDEEFNQFLQSEVSFDINAHQASFFGGPMLHGYVGNHTYILIEIKEHKHLIEFTNEPADLSRKPAYQDKRKASGEKVVEMLAFHKKLQETNGYSLHYALTKMKAGINDCYSYINKILIGTNQSASCLSRYTGMNRIGHLVGFFSEGSSPIQPGLLEETTIQTISIPLSKSPNASQS